ncbi:MAG: sugar phosphate isomerase/epimerase family protein [Armatimonadota bacterium]
MYKSLMPELLSLSADLPRAIEMASRYGFDGVDTGSGTLADPSLDIGTVRDLLQQNGVRPGYFGLAPGRVPVPEDDWQTAVAGLPLVARNARALGFTRAALVVLPFHETLTFDDAFSEHVRRLNEIMPILDDHAVALALEYVAAPSRRAPYSNHFVYDLAGMLRLCEATDSPNVGILLDSFHWHGASETVADLELLTPEKIVVVHVNDAPDLPLDEQTIGNRALPGATGVIDIRGFMGALKTVGYDGPITCEPMAGAIRAISETGNESVILSAVSASLDAIMP